MNLVPLLVTVGLLLHPRAEARPRVEYVVQATEARAQIVRVSMHVRGVAGESMDVQLPVWRPGRYQVLDMAGTFRSVTARNGAGQALACEKIDKATWRIATQGANEVVVDSVIYANSLGDRTRHADDTHVFLSPAAAFLYVPELRDEPCRVRIDAPHEWHVATGLKAVEGGGGGGGGGAGERVFEAANYDVLVDSPLEIGLHEVITFGVDDGERKDVPHEIVIWTGRAGGKTERHSPQRHRGEEIGREARPDDGNIGRREDGNTASAGEEPGASAVLEPLRGREHWDPEKLKADFAKVVAAEREVFGDLPYERYVYIVHCYPGGGGGTEHLNSTVMQASPTRFDTSDGYRGFMGLMSHEMFHTWNVKQLRPAGIKPYDYQRENYTRLLWVAEGTTSYYDDLVLARTGIMKTDDYLKVLGDGIDAARRRPGTHVQSLEDSSFDAWIKYNKPTPDAANSTVSFYDKGAQASLVLDMAIREATTNGESLDDVMRDLYRAFPLSGPGFTTDDFLAAVNEHAGDDLTELFTRAVRTTEPLDFESALRVVGLELKLESEKKTAKSEQKEEVADGAPPQEKPEESASPAPDNKAYLGLSVGDSGGLATVSNIASDGPAYAAGIIAGDTIIAVNGERFKAADLAGIEKRLKPGDMVRITFFRYDAMRDLMVTAAARPDAKWTVKRMKEPSEQQKAAYESWIGQKWPEGKKADGQ